MELRGLREDVREITSAWSIRGLPIDRSRQSEYFPLPVIWRSDVIDYAYELSKSDRGQPTKDERHSGLSRHARSDSEPVRLSERRRNNRPVPRSIPHREPRTSQ